MIGAFCVGFIFASDCGDEAGENGVSAMKNTPFYFIWKKADDCFFYRPPFVTWFLLDFLLCDQYERLPVFPSLADEWKIPYICLLRC